MAYQCLACSYQAEKMLNGACPGCGSRNIRSLKQMQKAEASQKRPYQLFIGAILWGYLIYALINKFY